MYGEKEMNDLKDFCRAFFKRESISVGDIFVFTLGDNEDPFKRRPDEEVEIIAIKEGYVQYQSSIFTSADSHSIFMFRSMYRKKKKEK
jgi:hypothetical protein